LYSILRPGSINRLIVNNPNDYYYYIIVNIFSCHVAEMFILKLL